MGIPAKNNGICYNERIRKRIFRLSVMDTLSNHELSEREQEVLTLIAEGMSNKSIAEQLVLSPHTVAWYVQQIFSKLGVNRRTQAVAIAREQGLLGSSPEQEIEQPPITTTHHNLPLQLTSFIGRDKEIHDICRLLQDSSCHLLTIVGPGGIGKTRLALEVALHLLQNFRDGVYFVPLQNLTSSENVIPAIASSLGIQLLADRQNILQQVIEYCRDKSLLIVIDNFEHLLDATQIVSDVLMTAPNIKILVTSRESLNLREERLFNVSGLPFPENGTETTLENFSAVTLFVERAYQVYPNFELSQALSSVVRICQLVAGIPLALEFAASWLKTLSCTEIVTEIETGLEILTTPFRNVPDRHRSMQAVFDYSWQLLTAQEQTTFACLSVFRGGCIKEAAIAVAGTNLQVLQGLVDKSFIQRNPHTKRYTIHELMRQYGEGKLTDFPEEATSVSQKQSAYFMDLLANHHDNVTNYKQLDMMTALEPDLDNIRVAWHTAVTSQNVESIKKALKTFAYFHVFRSRFMEEANALEFAIQHLDVPTPSPQHSLVLATLRSYCGWIYIRVGEYEQAEKMFVESHHLYVKHNLSAIPGWGSEPLTGLTLLASIRGDYSAAEAYGEQARQISTQRNDLWNLQLALYCSTSASFHQGNYEEAQKYALQALDISQNSGDQWFRAIVLNDLGHVAGVLNDYEQAKNYYRQSLTIRQQFDDAQGMAAALFYLGKIASLEETHTEAKNLYQESYAHYKSVGDRGGMGYAVCGLGTIAFASGDYDESRSLFHQALSIANDFQYAPFAFAVLNDICQLLLYDGHFEQVVQILAMTLHHQHSDYEARDQANQLLQVIESDLKSQLGITEYDAIWRMGEMTEPKDIVQDLLDNMYQP